MFNVDFKQLAIFVELAKVGHFAKTAEHFHLTASAVTRSIQRLESTLNCKLLARTSGKFSLTPEGEAFLVFARETLEDFQGITHKLQALQMKVSGTLRLYCSVTASVTILPRILSQYRRAFPDVAISLHTGDHEQGISRVLQGQDDIAVAVKPGSLSDAIGFRLLTRSRLRFVMARNRGVTYRAVAAQLETRDMIAPEGLPMIVTETGWVRQQLDAWLGERQTKANIYATVSGHEAILSMVAHDCGVALLPEVVIENSLFRDTITVIEAAPEMPFMQIGLCVLKERLTLPSVRSFWDRASAYYENTQGVL